MGFLDFKDAIRLGATLGDEFATAATPELIQYLKDHRPLPHSGAVRLLLQNAAKQAPSLKLNMLKRLKLLAAFRASLLKHEFSQRAIEELVSLLVPCLSVSGTPLNQTKIVEPESVSAAKSLAQILSDAQTCITCKQYEKALTLFRKYTQAVPKDASAATNYGAVLLQLGHVKEGERELRRAISLRPTFASPYLNLGSLLLWQGELLAAEPLLRRAVKLEPTNAKALSILGAVLVQLNQLRQAERLYKKALELSPDSAQALSGLGALHSLLGDKVQCLEYFERALRSDPNCVDAIVGLSALRLAPDRMHDLANLITGLLTNGCSEAEEVSLRFSLGALLDRLNEFKSAFQQYERANELRKRSAIPYDPVLHSKIVNDTICAYTQEVVAATSHKASHSQRPVFVVGMMRSGTSLVEQIIASHPLVYGAGELEFWHQTVRKQPDLIEGSPPNDRTIHKLAEEYLKILEKHSKNAARVVDKSTFNLHYLGLIHRVLPDARIIWVHRDPVDTCLSCYFHNFINGASFTMDLESLAYYYREQYRLALHWRRVLPKEVFLEIRYEDLVTNQEKWSQRMLEFLGLDWDPKVLEFYKTDRPVLTASVWQVRERMYSNSIGRWKTYRKYIKPLLKLQDISNTIDV